MSRCWRCAGTRRPARRAGGLADSVEAAEFAATDALALAPELSAEQRHVWAELFVQPHSLRTAVAEYTALDESFAQVAANGSLGDTPLVVARGLRIDEWVPAQALDAYGITTEVVVHADRPAGPAADPRRRRFG